MPRPSLLALRKNPRRNRLRFDCMVPAMAIQEQVNRRLENGEKGRTLVAWLNALPEVSAVLAAEFVGKAIREQNLSHCIERDT